MVLIFMGGMGLCGTGPGCDALAVAAQGSRSSGLPGAVSGLRGKLWQRIGGE
jgi:hypothetical protein